MQLPASDLALGLQHGVVEVTTKFQLTFICGVVATATGKHAFQPVQLERREAVFVTEMQLGHAGRHMLASAAFMAIGVGVRIACVRRWPSTLHVTVVHGGLYSGSVWRLW